MGYFSTINIPYGFQSTYCKVILVPSAITARCSKTFTGQTRFFQYLQGIGLVSGQLIRAFLLAPLPVLHILRFCIGVGLPGLYINYPGVTHHLGMYVPVRQNHFPYKIEACLKFSFGPPGNEPAHPPRTGRIGNNTVFPFYTIFKTPFGKLPYKRVGNLPGKLSPVLLILIGEYFRKLRDAIICHIHKACGIINDKAYGNTVVGIYHFCNRGSGTQQVERL